MDQDTLRCGDFVRLLTKPIGCTTKHLPLTVGNIYRILYFDGSNVVTTTDVLNIEGSYWRGWVEKYKECPGDRTPD